MNSWKKKKEKKTQDFYFSFLLFFFLCKVLLAKIPKSNPNLAFGSSFIFPNSPFFPSPVRQDDEHSEINAFFFFLSSLFLDDLLQLSVNLFFPHSIPFPFFLLFTLLILMSSLLSVSYIVGVGDWRKPNF